MTRKLYTSSPGTAYFVCMLFCDSLMLCFVLFVVVVVVVVVVIVVVCMLNKGNMHHTVHMCTYAIRCDTGLDDRRLDGRTTQKRKKTKKIGHDVEQRKQRS